MRTAEILTYEGMKDGFARPGIAHLGVQGGQHRSLSQIVMTDQGVIGLQDHLILEVSGLLAPDHWVDEDPIHKGERRLLHVLMPEVWDIASLKPPHRAHPLGGEQDT